MMPWANHVTLGAGHVPHYDDPPAVAAAISSTARTAAKTGRPAGAQA
jgi:hypothetical protein